jgi:hypothetical protein
MGKNSIYIVCSVIVLLFAVFIVFTLSNPADELAEKCYTKINNSNPASQFCGCMHGYSWIKNTNIGQEGMCRIGYRNYNEWEFFCKMNPTDSTFNNCVSIVAQKLSSFAPRYDSHLISGKIYSAGKIIDKGTVIFYIANNPKDKIIDTELDKQGNYEIDIAQMPNGWRVGDVAIIEAKYMTKTVKKTITIKSMAHQVEDVS